MTYRKPILVYLLAALLALQGVGAIYGGGALVCKPDGSLLQMPVSFLKVPLFHNFLIPGLILLFVLGLFPLLTAVCVFISPSAVWPNMLNINKAQHWALTFAQYTGIMLVVFINIELIITQTYMILQPVFALLGLLIITISISPPVYRYYMMPTGQPDIN